MKLSSGSYPKDITSFSSAWNIVVFRAHGGFDLRLELCIYLGRLIDVWATDSLVLSRYKPILETCSHDDSPLLMILQALQQLHGLDCVQGALSTGEKWCMTPADPLSQQDQNAFVALLWH